MGKVKDLTGQHFGKLVALERAGISNRGCLLWKCQCDCGNTIVAESIFLLRGSKKSCGCMMRKHLQEGALKHGGSYSRLYHIWIGMKQRCHNPKNKDFGRYGEKGITVCQEWQDSFESFRKWSLANGYSDELSIDRKVNDKGYTPENCRWTTMKEQANNRRTRNQWMKG